MLSMIDDEDFCGRLSTIRLLVDGLAGVATLWARV
jgi:hypothetical protein